MGRVARGSVREDDGVIPRNRSFVVPIALGLVLAIAAVACTGGGEDPPPTPTDGVDGSALVSQVASSDLYVDAPQRVAVGVFASDPEVGVLLATSGAIEVALAPYEDGAGTPVEGNARYVPAPGTAEADAGPTLTTPAEGRGVYEVADVTFDEPGLWQATVTLSIDGEGPFAIESTPFNVLDEPSYPAPGDDALLTKNLTVDSDQPASAIDSRALEGAPIPDPELHEWTIADAVKQGRPVLAIFATPAYCESLFCGPVTDAIDELAATYADKAVFIHIEIWHEKSETVQELNRAAADWLFRDDNLTEPWLYLIDGKGVIADRWGPLFDVAEVEAAIAALPDMRR